MSRALCAPDSFKGTLSAAEVAAAMAAGVRSVGWDAQRLPLADGGEGTAEALLETLGGERRTARASDALGREIEAEYAVLADGRGVVEVAAASGLTLLSDDERDAWAASSRGTGELIAAAVAGGAEQVLVAAGGSATTDGGAGALAALHEAEIEALALIVLCDVRIPFEQAAPVFAPQKGADEKTVQRLQRRLDQFASSAPKDPRGVPLTGAAGGLAGGLWAHLGAKLVPGAAWMLDRIGFQDRLGKVALVLTGEGQLDATSAGGKLVGEVALRCRARHVRCCAIVGRSELPAAGVRELGLEQAREAGDEEAIAAAAAELAATCTSP